MKKKILYLTRTMDIGGTENVILSLCKYLKDDYDITVMASPGANVIRLNELHINYVKIDDICNMNFFQSIKFFKFLRRFIKNNGFSIIHTHHRKAAFFIRLIMPKKTKLIHTMHNSFYNKKIMTRFTLYKFTTIACGKSVFENLKNVYKLKNIICIQNGIDNIFDYNEVIEIKKYKSLGYFVYGFVGRICEQKGIDILLKVFNEIKEKDKIVLFIYGKGDLSYLNSINKNIIKFCGETKNPLNVINQLDCLILPSRWEGLPLNILEAFSTKTLILCSDISNNIELVNESNGYVFKSEDIDDFYSKVINIPSQNFDNKILNAYKLYCEKFDISQFIAKYKEVYNKQ